MKKLTVRNLIYSTLAIALASSYFYVQNQSQHPDVVVATDKQTREFADQSHSASTQSERD